MYRKHFFAEVLLPVDFFLVYLHFYILILVLLMSLFHYFYCCQFNYFHKPYKSQCARDCPPKEVLLSLRDCSKIRGHSMDTDGETLGNTSQNSACVSVHQWPRHYQAVGRCYRKALCKTTIIRLCRYL